MKKTFRTITLLLLAVLMLFTSCNDKLQKMDEGSVNEYIYPYIKFEPAEDVNSVTAVVVAGAQLNTVKIPATVDGVKVNTFIGFENPEDAKSVKEIVIGSHDTVITDEALKQAINLENVKVESNSFFDKWSELPLLEKDGYEFLGWYAGEDKIYAGMPLNPNNSNAIPKWRAHKYIEHEGKEPTCTEAGWKPYKTCETCDYNDKVVLPALGHDFKHVDRISPTCTENGQIEHYICTRCGWLFSAPDPEARINDVVIQPEGHKMQHYPAKAPTCTGIGYDEHWVCTVCEKYFIKDSNDAYKEVSFADIKKDPIEHPWKSEWSYDKTKHWHECSKCGEKTDIEAHIWENPEVIQAPTESVPGKVRYTCKCGAEDIRTIQPENHEFKLVDSQDASCTKTGFKDYLCSKCGLTYRETIPASGHKPEKVERVEPTCQREGNVEYWYCSQCENLYSAEDCNEGSLIENGKQVLPKVDHKFEGKWLSNENGHYKMCSFGCGTSSDLIPHVFDQKVATSDYLYSDATCAKPAIYWKSCICGRKSNVDTFEYGKPLPHKYEIHDAVEPTCIKDGNVKYWTCDLNPTHLEYFILDENGEKFEVSSDEVVLEALGHEFIYVPVLDTNTHQKICSRCHEEFGNPAPHVETWIKDPDDPEHFHKKVCSVCGADLHESSLHIWIKDSKGYKCADCGYRPQNLDDFQGDGGFGVLPNLPSPEGKLEGIDNQDGTWTIQFIQTDEKGPIVSFNWSVNGVLQNEKTDTLLVIADRAISYHIVCKFENRESGNSASFSFIGKRQDDEGDLN